MFQDGVTVLGVGVEKVVVVVVDVGGDGEIKGDM